MKKIKVSTFLIVLFCLCFASVLQAKIPEESNPITNPSVKISYRWSDFLMGKSCKEDFLALQNLPFATEIQERLKNQMQTYCLGTVTVWKNLLTTFRQNKKDLLINDTLNNKNSVTRYFKVIPFLFFDLHETHPTGKTLLTQLDRIQNAIQAKNAEQILSLMQDLSPNQQLFLMPVFNEASLLLDFKETLEGDHND